MGQIPVIAALPPQDSWKGACLQEFALIKDIADRESMT
jgi:hypothetical protein